MDQVEPQDNQNVQQFPFQEQNPQAKVELKVEEAAELKAKIFATIEREDKDLFTLTKLKHVMCDYQKMQAELRERIKTIVAESPL